MMDEGYGVYVDSNPEDARKLNKLKQDAIISGNLKPKTLVKILTANSEIKVRSILRSEMKKQITDSFDVNRLLGEFIGYLKGILCWDIPDELRNKIEVKIKELEETIVNLKT